MATDRYGISKWLSHRQQKLVCLLISRVTRPEKLVHHTGYTPQQLAEALRDKKIESFATSCHRLLMEVVSAELAEPMRCDYCGVLCASWPCVQCQVMGHHNIKNLLSTVHYRAAMEAADDYARRDEHGTRRRVCCFASARTDKRRTGKRRKNRNPAETVAGTVSDAPR